MNVGSVGASGGYTSSFSQSDIQKIEQQIKDMQQKIQETQRNEELDDEQKDQLIQLYSKQLSDLQVQKSQLTTEQARAQTSGAQQPVEMPEEKDGTGSGFLEIGQYLDDEV